MLVLDDCLTINAARCITHTTSWEIISFDIRQTPTGFTGVNMRYPASLNWLHPDRETPILRPGDIFKVSQPEQGILVVDDNLDFQVMTEEEYTVMKSMCVQPESERTPDTVDVEIQFTPPGTFEHIDISCIVTKSGVFFNSEDENA